jgi:hypothetical protein
VALALVSAREADGMPVLIALIGDGHGDLSQLAEDYLLRLAGDNGPKALPDGDENKKKRSEAWAAWWKDNKTTVALVDRNAPAPRARYLGHTILIQNSGGIQKVQEVDATSKVRWEITGLLNPWDAMMLPGERVLITEYNGMRVTERNLKGEILWQKQVSTNPMYAERLKNGNTFIVCRTELIEVNRAGHVVFKIPRPFSDVMSARKLPNGQTVLVTNNRQVIRFNRAGKEIKTYSVPNIFYNSNEVLNNGHLLVPLGWNNRVEEYDLDGRVVASITTVMQPVHALRLPNGNTLVSSSQSLPHYKISEVDRDGRVVSEVTTPLYASRARRR